jgi:hypothetical protein
MLIAAAIVVATAVVIAAAIVAAATVAAIPRLPRLLRRQTIRISRRR